MDIAHTGNRSRDPRWDLAEIHLPGHSAQGAAGSLGGSEEDLRGGVKWREGGLSERRAHGQGTQLAVGVKKGGILGRNITESGNTVSITVPNTVRMPSAIEMSNPRFEFQNLHAADSRHCSGECRSSVSQRLKPRMRNSEELDMGYLPQFFPDGAAQFRQIGFREHSRQNA